MSELPLVTVVTPVHNGAKFIRQLIESVKEQTYPNIEHIVIDDGSTDGGETVAILAEYPHLNWWTRENRGQSQTLNEGFKAAKGEWVTTISHDDYYTSPKSIEYLVRHAQSHPGAQVIYGRTRFVDVNGAPVPIQQWQAFPFWMIQYHCYTFMCAMIVRNDLLREKNVYFDPNLIYFNDDDWLKRLSLAGLVFSHVRRTITDYRTHANQATNLAYVDAEKARRREAEGERMAQTYGLDPALRKKAKKLVKWDKRYHRLLANLRGYYRKHGQWYRIGVRRKTN